MSKKQLQIFKIKPDEITRDLSTKMAGDKDVTCFYLDENQDYDDLVSLILTCDEIISWP